MTRDDILRMTREAHLDVYNLGKDHQQFMSAVECVAYSAFTAGALAEREACAKVCGDMLAMTKYEKIPQEVRFALYEAENAIRARGQA